MLKLYQILSSCINNYTIKDKFLKGMDANVLKKMQFRPCIDIHNGKVKQIVGSSLKDMGNHAVENFVSTQDAADFARMYREDGIRGGHIILLNAVDSEFYEATRAQAIKALQEYPGGLQIGGGITAENAPYYIREGASHVIVTSYVFKNGKIHYGNLDKLVNAVGKEHLVLDLSCRYVDENHLHFLSEGMDSDMSESREPGYYIVTDRWQRYTTERVTAELLDDLSQYCDEFLVHAVDVEGKQKGIEIPLVELLGEWGKLPITYAGGVHTYSDLYQIAELGKGRLNVTIGSALDLFGGEMKYKDILTYMSGQ